MGILDVSEPPNKKFVSLPLAELQRITKLHDLDCPKCDGKLMLRNSRYGLFWGCSNYKETGCKAAHGAHPDGTPLGIPADDRTKQARIEAHAEFDKLWKDGPLTRGGAYRWMQAAMHMREEEAHIGRFTYEQCELLKEKVTQALERLRPDLS